MAEATTIIYWVSAGLLGLAALLALVRLSLGKTLLDRAVALDIVTAVAIASVALLIVWRGRQDLMVMLIIFALTGFLSSATIARFVSRESGDARRILSQEEARYEEAARQLSEERQAAIEAKELKQASWQEDTIDEQEIL